MSTAGTVPFLVANLLQQKHRRSWQGLVGGVGAPGHMENCSLVAPGHQRLQAMRLLRSFLMPPFLRFIKEVGSYGFFKFLFLSIFEGSSIGIIPMGKSVRAQHPPTIVKGVLGFLPFLDGAKNFLKFFDTEVGDILAVVSEG